jgi:beta-hydroxylase
MVSNFLTIDEFPQLQLLQGHWKSIRDEFLNVQHLTVDWPEQMLHNGRWKAFGILYRTQYLPTMMYCPFTTSLIKELAGVQTAGFSILEPGCVIAPHTGYTKNVYRSHLGLICNEESSIVVDGESYTWKEGEMVVFDDTKEHSAKNEGATPRVILLVDFVKYSRKGVDF